MKKLLLCLWAALCTTTLWAQNYVIEGTVRDEETWEILIGASIAIPGATIGTLSNEEGKFRLQVPGPKGNFQVSYIGYSGKDVAYEVEANEVLKLEVLLGQDEITLPVVEVLGAYPDCIETRIICRYPGSWNSSYVISTNNDRWHSQPAIMQAKAPGLAVFQNQASEGAPIHLQYQGLPIGMAPAITLNGMPMDARLGATMRYLWEEDLRVGISGDELDRMGSQGPRALGGTLNYAEGNLFPGAKGLRYRGMVGLALPYAEGPPEAGPAFRQKHELAYQNKSEKQPIRATLSYVDHEGPTPGNGMALLGGAIRSQRYLGNGHWFGSLRGAQLSSQRPGNGRQVSQFALLQNRLSLNPTSNLQVSLRNHNQVSRQATIGQEEARLQNHFNQLELRFHPDIMPDLGFTGGYEYRHWGDRQNHALRLGGQYYLGSYWSLAANVRQDRQHQIQEDRWEPVQTATVAVAFGLRNGRGLHFYDNCVPSRSSFRLREQSNISLESGLMTFAGNRAWLNQLKAQVRVQERVMLSANLNVNHFVNQQALDLGWLNWNGQGNQTQIGGNLQIQSNHQFKGWYWSNQAYFSYNRPFLEQIQNPLFAPSSPQARTAALPFSGFMPTEQMPRGMMGLVQSLTRDGTGVSFNLWAWLHAPEGAKLGDGLRLQEVRFWHNLEHWTPRLRPLSNLTVFVMGENLLNVNPEGNVRFDLASQTGNYAPLTRNLMVGLEMTMF